MDPTILAALIQAGPAGLVVFVVWWLISKHLPAQLELFTGLLRDERADCARERAEYRALHAETNVSLKEIKADVDQIHGAVVR